MNFGITPHFKYLLEKQVLLSEWFVLCYDESLNKVIQESAMDLVIRFWDNSSYKVQVLYWDSLLPGHNTLAFVSYSLFAILNQLLSVEIFFFRFLISIKSLKCIETQFLLTVRMLIMNKWYYFYGLAFKWNLFRVKCITPTISTVEFIVILTYESYQPMSHRALS